MALTLVIGNKAYSSWSMRPWLALVHAGIPFEEVVIPLDQPQTREAILGWGPVGKVPILVDGDAKVWESIAILEHLANRFPEAGLWPEDPVARAFARSVATEMHGGFAALRRHYYVDLKRGITPKPPTPEASADIARITAIWREARERFGASGPWLCGSFSAADAMYAPVATRFRTWAVPLDPVSAAYVDTVYASPAFRRWYDEAQREPWIIDYDAR